MRRQFVFLLVVLLLVRTSTALAQPMGGGGPFSSPFDATAIHAAGAQTMTGPLTLTTGGIEIPSGQKICLDGATCAKYLNVSGGAVYAAGSLWSGGVLTAGDYLDVRSKVYNGGSANGGSVALDDPLRNLSTTVALFESSTAATAGVDTAFRMASLNTLASGDVMLSVSNPAGTPVAKILGDGSLSISGMAANGAAFDSLASGGNRIILYQDGRVASNNTTTVTNLGNALSVRLLSTMTDGAGAVGAILDNSQTLSTAGAKLVSVRNNTSEKANWDKDGMPQIGIGNVGAAPTCDATTRMKIWAIASGAGIADTVQICVKSAADAYAWQNLY